MKNFKLWLENLDFSWAIDAEVPPEPGTSPIPNNHIRLFHYTKFKYIGPESAHQAANSLKTQGLDIKKAKGNTYGEPNVVWASAEQPQHGHVFAEFSVSIDDPRLPPSMRPDSIQKFNAGKSDIYLLDSINPEEILAVHEPWHSRYNYILKNPRLHQAVKNGEHDQLLNNDDYGPAVMKAKIKQ